MHCIARTQSIEEAERIAENFRMQGFEVKLVAQSRGHLKLYEVWVSKGDGLVLK